MTEFIESFTTQQLLPPWISSDGQFWSFVVEVPPHCMQDYLDSHFNAPAPDQAPYYYSAIKDFTLGVLTVCDHVKFASLYLNPGREKLVDQESAGWDTLQHAEVYWSFPAVRHRITPGNLLVEPKVVWVQPFAFDNNSSVLFAGREILGTEFEMGDIRIDKGEGAGNLHIDVAVQGFDTFGPAVHARTVPVLHARLTSDGLTSAANLDRLGVFYKQIASSIAGFVGPGDPDPFAIPDEFELNTLKQFRDVFDMRFAAYRALIASTSRYGTWKDVTLYDGQFVSLDFMWTASLAEKFERLFGLTLPDKPVFGHPDPDKGADQNSDINWNLPRLSVPVQFAFSYTTDVTFAVTDTLHVYGQQGT